MAAVGFSLLAAALCVATAAIACLLGHRDDPLGAAAPTLLVVLPAWAAAALTPWLSIQPAQLPHPAPALAGGLLVALVLLWRFTRPGLIARAALVDAPAARAIGLPVRQAGGPMLAAAWIAAAGAGWALASALPTLPTILLLAVAAWAGLAARAALVSAIIGAALGGAAGTAAIMLSAPSPAMLAAAMLLPVLLAGGLQLAGRRDA